TCTLRQKPPLPPPCDARDRSVTGASRPPSRASHALALLRHVVDEQVLAEAVRTRVERAPLVDARHALDEGAHARAVVEHEGVDDDAAAGDTLDLLERLLRGTHGDAAERQRPLAVEPAAQAVGRRPAG